MAIPPWQVSRLPLKQYQYLKLRMQVISADPNHHPSTTELTFRMCIQQALQSLFGLVGAAIIVDVLDWNEKTNIGYIRVNQSELVTVWNALMLHQFRISDVPCNVEVLCSSASLISLADDSR